MRVGCTSALLFTVIAALSSTHGAHAQASAYGQCKLFFLKKEKRNHTKRKDLSTFEIIQPVQGSESLSIGALKVLYRNQSFL